MVLKEQEEENIRVTNPLINKTKQKQSMTLHKLVKV